MPYYSPYPSYLIALRAPYSQLAATTPSALQEFGNSTSGRARVDLSAVRQARITIRMNSPASAGTLVRAQYLRADDGSGVFNYLDGATGPEVDVGGVTGTAAGSWVGIVPNAMTDVILRVVTLNGDGVTSANWANIYLEVR